MLLKKYYTPKAIYDFLKIYKINNITCINEGGYIEYNGMLFTTPGGAIGVLPYDRVRFGEAQFQFCDVTTDGSTLLYKMILPIAHYNCDNDKLEDVSFDERFIELVKNSKNEWCLNEFIQIEDYIDNEQD